MTHSKGMKFARTLAAGVFFVNYFLIPLQVLSGLCGTRGLLTRVFYNYLSYLLQKTRNGRKGNRVERYIFLQFPIQFIFVAYLWTLVVIMVCDTPSRDDHEVQSNRTCILLPGNMRLRFNRFVYFWRGFICMSMETATPLFSVK